MRTTVGIFTARSTAEQAGEQLRAVGFPPDRITVLSPGRPERAASEIPATHGEPPGMGAALGSVVGGAVGMATGFPLGAAMATLLVPGVGPVIATGIAAGALLGLGGAALGTTMERTLTEGLPKDEVFVYEDALRQGRTVVIALADDEAQAETARAIFAQAGAESVDAAREQWWIGLRSAERERYQAEGRAFETEEPAFRRGFEAALRIGLRGRSYGEGQGELRDLYPDVYHTDAFRHGYERGLAYWEGMQELRGREAA